MNETTSVVPAATHRAPDGPPLIVVQAWNCPMWCEGPPHHFFEPVGDGHDALRTHERVMASVDVADDDPLTEGVVSAQVVLCQDEVLRSAGAGGVVLEAPYVFMDSVTIRLTAEQAHLVGQGLLVAAERAQKILAGVQQ